MSELMSFDDAFRAADLAVRAVRAEGLRDIERVVLEGSWYRQTYQKIASTAGYTEGYLSRDVGPALWDTLSQALGVQVKKTNFRTAIERWSEQAQKSSEADLAATNGDHAAAPTALTSDIITTDTLPFDVTDFRGREDTLARLTTWMIDDRGRLLCLSGLPGSGKSWLAVKLAECVRDQFQRFIYQDLRDRPTPSALIDTLLTTLGVPLPESTLLSDQLDVLIQALVSCPSLIVLDSTEKLCQPQQLAGVYAPELAEYHKLLAALANREHQSCVVWVGREPPRAASAIAGSSCRRYPLAGLTADEIAELAVWPDDIDATSADWRELSQHYGGLPALILTKIASRLASFGNRLGACLEALHHEQHFVYSYLDEWLAPLSALEWRVLTWMMISQRPLSLTQLSAYLGLSAPLDALNSLCDRGICRAIAEADPAWELVLPELLSPYLCDRFLTTFWEANEAEQFTWLGEYPLLQAEAPEMVRQWQRQTLLTAVAQHLENQYPQPAEQQRFLEIAFYQSQTAGSIDSTLDYRPGNLLNLAHHWQISLTQVDLQGLKLHGADLQSDLFQGVSFAGADLNQTLLAQPMGQCPTIAVNSQRAEIAVGDQDGRLLLWDLQTGRLQRAMLTVTQAICAIAYSPDGNTLAEARQGGTVRLWDLLSELGPERFAELDAGSLTTLAFSADKLLLAGGDEQGNLHIWRLASGEKIHRIPAHTAAVTAIAFSPCSQRLLSCGRDRAALEWHLETGDSLNRFEGRLTALLGTVAYRPTIDGELMQPIVVGQDDGQLVVWELASARPQFIMNEPCEAFMAIALSPDGQYLAASEMTNTVSVWDVESRSRLCQLTEPQAPVESLVFRPNQAELITGCDYSVQRWQLPSGEC
ncbi:MAG: AAA family ATPase, partial [Cyanobacteria bacterium P01_D01_bin.71]